MIVNMAVVHLKRRYHFFIFFFTFLALDDIGHGARWNGSNGTPRGRRSGSAGAAPLPAPTTKPPTPPAVVRSASAANTGTLGRGTLGMLFYFLK